MGLVQVVCMGLLAAVARTQVLQDCSADIVPLTVESTDDAAALATSIFECPDGDYAVQWVGEVSVQETIRVTGGTSLNITGAGPGAIADGGGDTQLFSIDGGSRLHLSDMVLSNGTASHGGAIFANQSSVSFTRNMSFFSNSAEFGGAISVLNSILSWDGDGTDFGFNSAAFDGGALWAGGSTVSWAGDGTTFFSNNAEGGGGAVVYEYISGNDLTFNNNSAASGGGAVYAWDSSKVFWNGDGTVFTSNYGLAGGAIVLVDSTVAWEGEGTEFRSNSAAVGGAIYAEESNVSWAGDGTAFISNNASEGFGGALLAYNLSSVSWDGDGTAFVSNNAEGTGGAIAVFHSSNVSWDGDDTIFSDNSAVSAGGAIKAWNSSKVSWNGDGTVFASNYGLSGGAICVYVDSTVAWSGESTAFISNNASERFGGFGGAIIAFDSTVAWEGDGAEFRSNFAALGGAIYAEESNVSWAGDGTAFISNNASEGLGGALLALNLSSVSWDGDGTAFISNNAENGGAIAAAQNSKVSWDGDGTQFSSNYGLAGGAIWVGFYSTVAWNGAGAEFISNSAGSDGGAIYVISSTVLLDTNTNFSSNFAGGRGGALAISDLDQNTEIGPFDGTALIENSATTGGAIYLSNCENVAIYFTDVIFQSNSANVAGGAVAAFATGDEIYPAIFRGCTFLNNRAGDSGGAVETLAGRQLYYSCEFVGNSADVGGAMRLGGSDYLEDCSFLSNSASSRGFAVAVISEVYGIKGASFDGNELICEAGEYRRDTEEGFAPRYETVCLDCPEWDACDGCTITRATTPACEAPIEHTTAFEPGVTFETLNIDEGYWRATNTSETILACYNADACIGGVTGADTYCDSGYTGPYCAVCETDYSPSLAHTCTRCSSSRRQGLMAATVIVALVALVAVVTTFKFLLRTKVEAENTGWFHRRVVRAIPVQALKIVVVVWQILTQFADAANTSYPGVYQDFLSAIDVVNFDLGSVLAAGCLLSDIDFHARLLLSTLGPLVFVGLLAITYMIALRGNGTHGNAAAVDNTRRKHLATLLLLTFLVYSSVSSMVFQTFACETLDDGIEYLRADYRIHCTDAKHKGFEVYAGIMVFVYPVGIPLLYAALLFERRDVLADAVADKTIAQPIAGLWEAYRPERFYYEVVECGRRILLTGVVVFIFPNDAAQIAITIIIAFFFFAVFEILSPYQSESDMWLSRGGHVIVFLSMFDLLLLKVDVSDERAQSQAAFAGVLVAGHVLMVFAIVVEVAAICYASRKDKVVEGGGGASERPRVGSDDAPVFESAPAPWRSFLRQGSVSEKTGPTRGVSGTLGMTGEP